MTNEERDLITRFVQRVGGQPAAGGFVGSVPSTGALPPIDREADALLADLFQRFPEARYRVTQYAFVQEHALAEAQTTIRQLQAQLAQAQAPQTPSPWGAAAVPRGVAPQQPAYAPPLPPAAPGGSPGMFQQQGQGFLGSALRTAAGVAGGIFAADALMGLFGGRGGGFGGGALGGGNTTIIENNYASPGNDPWGAGGVPNDQSGADRGGWTDNGGAADPDADMDNDPGGFDNDPNSV